MPVFLDGGGQCGALIKARDWSGTLGPVENWPQSLKAATGLLLRSPIPIAMLWGEEGIMLYNDAYSGFAGGRHPQLLGSKVREGWPEIADFNDHVMSIGLAGGTLSYRDQELTLHRNGRPEQVWMNLDYSPVIGDDGRPAGVLAIVIETSKRVQTEQALRQREARLQFFDRLAQSTRHLSEASEIMAQTVQALGQKLNGSVCAYADMEPDEDTMNIRADWVADCSGSIVGTYSLAGFGRTAKEQLRAGNALVTCDTLAQLGPEEGRGLLDLGLQATVCMPLVRNGKLRALMAVHSSTPRQWGEDDLSLIAETTERSWAYIERVRAEEVLRDSQQHLEAIFNQTGAGIAEADVVGRFVNVNERFCEIVGRSREELLRLTVTDITHPEDISENRQLLNRLVVGGEPFRIEKRYLRPDGAPIWVTNTVSLVQRGTGHEPTLLAVSIDITDQKSAEEALKESELRYRTLFEVIEAGFCIVELKFDENGKAIDYRMVEVNPAFEEQTGLRDAEGRWISDLVPQLERHWFDTYGRVARTRTPERFENGSGPLGDRWFDVYAFPVGEPQEQRVGILFNDISERRRIELRLREAEERYRLAAKATNDAIWDWDLTTDQVIWNEAMTSLFGHVEPLTGTGHGWWQDRIHPDDRRRVGEGLLAAINGIGEGWSDEYRFIRADGGIAHVLDRGTVLRNDEGRAIRMIGAMLDITERKRSEQHQRLLIDELSHRAKNLLAIIQSVAQQSFKDGGDPRAMVSSFEGRLGALAAAHGILTRQRWEAAPIRQIICDTITAVKADDNRLRLDGPDLLIPPKTGVSLAMAIHELTTNAVKYGSFSNETGQVTVQWRVAQDRWKLEWRESGGPAVAIPSRRGFGSRMIERGLAAELGGVVTIDFEAEGVVCRVDAPFQVAA